MSHPDPPFESDSMQFPITMEQADTRAVLLDMIRHCIEQRYSTGWLGWTIKRNGETEVWREDAWKEGKMTMSLMIGIEDSRHHFQVDNDRALQKCVVIKDLEIAPRGQGNGTHLMEQLHEAAAKAGMRLAVTGITSPRFHRFLVKRFGATPAVQEDTLVLSDHPSRVEMPLDQ